MLICLRCEIEVEEGSTACPQCGGALEEVDPSEYEYVVEEEEGEGEEEESAEKETGEPPVAPPPAPASLPEAPPESDEAPPAPMEPRAAMDEAPAEPPEPRAEPDETPAEPPEPQAEPDEAPAEPPEPQAEPVEAPAEPPEPQAEPVETPAEPPEPQAEPAAETPEAAGDGVGGEEPPAETAPPVAPESAPGGAEEGTAGGEVPAAAPEEAAGGKAPKKGASGRGKAPRRKTSRMKGKDTKRRGTREVAAKEAKPPKSVRLTQRRLPVLIGALLTLFLSLYFAGDFVVSILVGSVHYLQAGLFLWGAVSFLFLMGHGRWGRGGALLLGVLGLGAGVFFMLKFQQENYLFLLGMGFYALAMLITTTGKGWFFRSLGGLILAPVVMVCCLASLALDFVPPYIVKSPSLKAIETSKSESSKYLGNWEKMDEACQPLRDALETNEKVLKYFEMVPWGELKGAEFVAFKFMGSTRVMDLYYYPMLLEFSLYAYNSRTKVTKDEPLVLEGAEPEPLSEPGVLEETIEVTLKDGSKCHSAFDYKVETGGRFEPTRIMRVEGSENIPDGATVAVTYEHRNHDRFEHIEASSTFAAGVTDILTGGMDIGQVGEAVGSRYGDATDGGYTLPRDKMGYQLLRQLFKIEVLYLDRKSNEAAYEIGEALEADPVDSARLDERVERAEALKNRFEVERDGVMDGLLVLIQWMNEKLDTGETLKHRTARHMIGDSEFDMIFFNYSRLLNALHDTYEEPYEGEGRKILEEAQYHLLQGQKAVLPGKEIIAEMDFRRQVARILSSPSTTHHDELRWKKVLELMAVLARKKRELGEATGEGGMQSEEVGRLAWTADKNSIGIKMWTVTLKAMVVPGAAEIPFEIRLLDPQGIVDESRTPFVRGLLLRTGRGQKQESAGFQGELFCHNAPEKGLKFALTEFKVLKPDGSIAHEFGEPARREYVVQQGHWVDPQLEWSAELDTLNFDPTPEHKAVLVVRALAVE